MELNRVTINITIEAPGGKRTFALTELSPDDAALLGAFVGDPVDGPGGAERKLIDVFDEIVTRALGGMAASIQQKMIQDRRRAARAMREM
jgi:hypothetical protein